MHEGKVRYIGSSNFAGWQIADADWTARPAASTRFVSAQNHYNLLERGVEDEVVPACERFGVGVLPYFPLACGLFTGKYQPRRGPPEGGRLAAVGRSSPCSPTTTSTGSRRSTAFGAERGHTLLEVAIGGLAARPPSRR